MFSILSFARTTSRATSYMLGFGVMVMAAIVLLTAEPLPRITEWAEKVLGLSFVVLIGSLVFAVLFCWVKLVSQGEKSRQTWFHAGLQAANGVTTLALTYTLLGISLGIGGLAGQELNPTTIPSIIKNLTEHFSMAFMTTVIGLPVSAVLRSALLVTFSRAEERTHTSSNGDNYYAVHPV